MPLDPSRVLLSDRVGSPMLRLPPRAGATLPARRTRLGIPLALFAAGCAASPAPIPGVTTPEPAPPEAPAIAARLVLPGVNFAFDSAEIDPVSAVVLDVAADPMRERTGMRVTVEGHTDSVGAEPYNEALSLRRAEAVRRYLVRKGVPTERLTARGLGESDPVASNATADGRARNRRVELEVAQ